MNHATFDQIAVIIPAYQPQLPLVKLVEELRASHFSNLLVINDGSSVGSQSIFEQVRALGAIVVTHSVNQGKGEALKTAFKHVLEKNPHVLGVLTCDADGQHLSKDIARVSEAFVAAPTRMVLGSRHFVDSTIPARSRFGNNLTKSVFKVLIGKQLNDTQTGLRAIPKTFLPSLIALKTGRYEFELEMLVEACKRQISIHEVPIETIYENGNESSHFNPLVDSLRIYFVFIRFLFSSILSAIIDTGVFTLIQYFSGHLFLSMSVARLTAGMVNFYIGRKFIFKSHGPLYLELFKYWLLVAIYLLISYSVVRLIVENSGSGVYLAKISTEALIFIFSFLIQRSFVFSSRSAPEAS